MISLTALLCPLLVLAFIVAIIVRIVRSAGRSGSSVAAGAARPPLNVVTQLGPDGFWLSSFEPSSMIYYQYWAAGTRYEGQIPFQPGSDGRQFIYTGVRPEQVAIVRVAGSSGDLTPGLQPYIEDVSTDIVSPILGAAAVEAVWDAVSSDAPQAPVPPSPPPEFPAAY